MSDLALNNIAERVLHLARGQGVRIATAESCTGGMIAAALTDIPGSSDVLDRGFVTYSNQAKIEMLGVDAAVIEAHGAVSEPVARAMAEGALSHSAAQLAVSVTGVAGPGGGTAEKPVGTVHIAVARKGAATIHRKCMFSCTLNRHAIRQQSTVTALSMLLERLDVQDA